MTREEEIIEITLFFDSIPEGCDFDRPGHTTRLATQLYDAGWHKQIKAKWVPDSVFCESLGKNLILQYICSACEDTSDNAWNYCPNCGARMEKK